VIAPRMWTTLRTRNRLIPLPLQYPSIESARA
jgi:hypothetical protein